MRYPPKICSLCGGTGKIKYPGTDDDVTCHKCQGGGYIIVLSVDIKHRVVRLACKPQGAVLGMTLNCL